MGSNNGLLPFRRQIIIWFKAGLFLFEDWKQISEEFQSNDTSFHVKFDMNVSSNSYRFNVLIVLL